MTDEPTADVPAARGAGATGAARPAASFAAGAGAGPGDRAGGSGADARTTVLPALTTGTTAAGSMAAGTTGAGTATPGTAAPGTTAPGSTTGAARPGSAGDGTDAGATGSTATTDTIGPSAPVAPTGAAAPPRRRRRWPVVVLALALVAALGAAGYLFMTARAYAERLEWTEAQARAIGTDLTVTRGELEGARGEIAALQTQLTTAQERITALADEKAQIGDDREAQRQLLDYQARVSEAAGTVASALDRCVQGQDQLIAYLEDAASYDPAELAQFGAEVEALCQSASEANEALQSELADR